MNQFNNNRKLERLKLLLELFKRDKNLFRTLKGW